MAFNYYKTGLIWDGSYLSNSLFSDIYTAIIPWKIFDNITIGSYKVFHYFLRYLTEIFIKIQNQTLNINANIQTQYQA